MCETNCLRIGHPAPEFSAAAWDPRHPDKMNHQVSLKDFKGKWTLLFFYPLDFTFVCPTELIHLGELNKEFEKLNCQIVAASTDSVFSHQAWAKQDERIGKLGFPILSDMSQEVAFDYDVLHKDGIALRGAFLIDPDGILQSMTVNNLSVGRNPEELLRTLKAFQTGDLCPVNWEAGEKTLGKA